MVSPHESTCLRHLYAAGAHVEVLARAVGRDPRTVQAALRREGIPLRRDPPVPRTWRADLSADTVQAIDAYLAQLQRLEEEVWQRLRHAAVDVTTAAYVFPTPETYASTLHTVEPAESVVALARRLGVDLNRVLLAYAEWAEEAETRRWRRHGS
jgi:hypothetical protein